MSDPADLVVASGAGAYCPAGGFHIDPTSSVERCVITHAHADHARAASGEIIAAAPGVGLLRARLGDDVNVRTLDYGQSIELGDTRVSLHPAGHVLGSAQVRIEHAGGVWVVSGDYKRVSDPTCAPFEPVPCDVLITEATFALPIYRWPPAEQVGREIWRWWQTNASNGRASVLYCYALGKAQRVLAMLAEHTDRAVFVHGAIEKLTALYREHGVRMLPTRPVAETAHGDDFAGALVLAPPSVRGSRWLRRFEPFSAAAASGWMRLRGVRRRQSLDRGFVLSDHADWPALLSTVRDSGARRVLTCHGYDDVLARHLREQGYDTDVFPIAQRTA